MVIHFLNALLVLVYPTCQWYPAGTFQYIPLCECRCRIFSECCLCAGRELASAPVPGGVSHHDPAHAAALVSRESALPVDREGKHSRHHRRLETTTMVYSLPQFTPILTSRASWCRSFGQTMTFFCPSELLVESLFFFCPSALKWYRTKENIQAEVEEMQEEQRSLSSIQTLSVCGLLTDRCVRWQLITIAVVNIGMQLSGIDAVSVKKRLLLSSCFFFSVCGHALAVQL